MAAAATQPTPKGSGKKVASPVERANSPAPSAGSGNAADSQDDILESPHIKELQKNIRNLNKKITNASKTDTILRQHSGKSLDELVASKILNPDQKAQIEKKPALKAQLAQAEEHLLQYLRVHEHYRARLAADKAEWEKSLEKARADAFSEAKAEFRQHMEDSLLTLSQFLRLAAYRREEARDPESDESQAIEGALLAIYAGDENAVSSMLKLVEGMQDSVLSVPGEPLQTTYSVVKTLAQEFRTPFQSQAPQSTEIEESADIEVDTTLNGTPAPETNVSGSSAPVEPLVDGVVQNGHANTGVSEDTDHIVSESQWDTENGLSASQEWIDVKIPQDTSDTGSGQFATNIASSQSWADDQPPEPVQQASPADPNDGFHPVQRNKSRQERDGSGNGNGYGHWRGRGRGEHRGRGGHRGDGRGRGRGRGGIASRPRRGDES